MQEDLHTAEWIVSKIEGDTGAGGLMETGDPMISGAYFGVIPPDVGPPAVRFHVQNKQDVRGVGDPRERIMVQLEWLIAAVTKGRGLAALVPIADRLDTVLHDSNGETSTIRVMACVRVESFTLAEEEDTAEGYRHAGGLYRTIVQSK
jgi:hypothetical protein